MSQMTLLKDLGLETAVADETTLPIVSTVQESVILNQQLQEAENKEVAGFWKSVGTGYKEDSLVSSIIDHADKASVVDDVPITNFTPELITRLTTGLNTEAAIDVLENANSYGFNTAMKQREINLATQKNLAEIEEAGFTGTLGRIFAMMFDPAEWAVIAGTTALATTLSSPIGGATALTTGVMKRAYDVKRAFKIGAVLGASENAAFEAIRNDVRYNIDINDVLIAGGAGALIGGGLNAGTIGFSKAAQRATINNKIFLGQKLTPAETKFFEAFNEVKLTEDIINKELSNPDFVEAGRNLNEPKGLPTEEEMAAIPKQAGWNLFGLRNLIATGSRLLGSDVDRARFAGNALGMNAAGFQGFGKATNPKSVTELMSKYQLQYRLVLSTLLPRERAKWVKRTGLTEEEFNTALARYMRGIDTDVGEEVIKVAKEGRRVKNELFDEAITYNVAGFNSAQKQFIDNYLTRQFNEPKINNLKQKFNDDQFELVVEKAIREGQPNIEDQVLKTLSKKGKTKGKTDEQLFDMVNDYIRKMAKGYTRSIINPIFRKSGLTDSSPTLREDMDKLFGDLFDEEAIDDITEILTKAKTTKDFKRAHARVILNEGTVIQAVNKNGQMEELRFSDLLEEDGEQLINSYIFQMSGAIGLARNGINTNVAGSQFDIFIKKGIQEEAAAKGKTSAEIQQLTDAVDFMYDGITGRLAHRGETQTVHDFNIALRAFSFAVNMGMSGMSALMELTNVMMEYSFMTILKSVPQYKQLFTDLTKPNADPNVIRELVQALGLGNEVALGNWSNLTRMDGEDLGNTITQKIGSKTGRITEKFALASQKHVAYLSGLTGVTQFLRRMSMLHFTNEFALAASKGKLPFSAIKRQQLGITDEMGYKIMQTLNNPKIVTRNPNGTIKELNIQKWDKNVAEDFSAVGFKDARTNVQESDLATSNRYLKSTQVGRSMFQFMNFTFSSMEQQSQRLGVRIMGGDSLAVAKLLTAAMGMGTLMYVARTHLNAAGRSDKEEYLEKRFEWQNIVAGAASQIGAASIFSYITQLSTGVLTGNSYAITPPAVSLLYGAGTSINSLFSEGDFKESEYRKALRLLPYQSLYGARQILNYTSNQFAN